MIDSSDESSSSESDSSESESDEKEEEEEQSEMEMKIEKSTSEDKPAISDTSSQKEEAFVDDGTSGKFENLM